jgi:hypothetical protein
VADTLYAVVLPLRGGSALLSTAALLPSAAVPHVSAALRPPASHDELWCVLSHVLSLLQDDESPTGTDDSSKQSPGEQSELPPGYGSFLDAHVRT